jgi:hypothetical protein
MNKFGGRKVVVTVICLIVGGALVLIKGDVPNNYLVLLQTILSAFILGNTAEHFAGKKAAAPAPVDNSETNKKLDDIATLLVQVGHGTQFTNDVLKTLAEVGYAKQNSNVPKE